MGAVKTWSANYHVFFWFFIRTKVYEWGNVLFKLLVTVSTTKWQQKQRSDDVFNSAGKRLLCLQEREVRRLEARSKNTRKQQKQLLGTDASNNDEKQKIWAELLQSSDKSCIITLKSDRRNNGREDWKWLLAYFFNSQTPLVLNLFERLMFLSLKFNEEMPD